MDASGNVYVADTGNYTIRKVTPAGVETTLAGSAGFNGKTNGTGTAARFYLPTGIAADSSGNIYVADTGNNTIRKVTPEGAVTTLAGSAGNPGSTDGTGTGARFAFLNGSSVPNGVAVDGGGNVFVADSANHTIRKVTPGGVVSTLAGSAGVSGSLDGSGSAALFNYPEGIAVDASGYVYVADTFNGTIRKVSPGGVVTTLVGSSARFSKPTGLAIDSSGNLYVADAGNYTISKVTPAGLVTLVAGAAGIYASVDGTGSAARFAKPVSVAVDSSGNLYVADGSDDVTTGGASSTIRKVTPAGAVSTLAGSVRHYRSTDSPGSSASFNQPAALAMDASGNIYVSDTENNTIRKVTLSGIVTTFAGSPVLSGSTDGIGATALFNKPAGIAVDSGGNVYVADAGNFTIRKILPDGTVSTFAGSAGTPGFTNGTGTSATFSSLVGLAVDGGGTVYVVDGSFIRKITPARVVSFLAGGGSGTNTDGTGSAASFSFPQGIAADTAGNLYVTDFFSIRKVTPGGVVSTVAGGNLSGTVDGPGSSAMFTAPGGITLDAAGNMYVTDGVNFVIRKVTPAGLVTTIAGGGLNHFGSIDGSASFARFSFGTLSGMAIDATGNLYVADTVNSTIRKLTPGGIVTTLAGNVLSDLNFAGNADGGPNGVGFFAPSGVAVDISGNVYLTDNNTIRKATPAGIVTTLAGTPGLGGLFVGRDGTGGDARMNTPTGMAVDGSGTVYFADSDNTIRKMTAGGVVTTLAGNAGNTGSLDGTGSAALFSLDSAGAYNGVALDASGNLYVADSGNNTIRKVTPAGVVTTIAGTAGAFGSTDGTAGAARFAFPSGTAIDGSGNLYVADALNGKVRKVTPGGIVSTLAGGAGPHADGAGTAAGFFLPTGIALDGNGNLYVTEPYNIRMVTPAGVVTTIGGTYRITGGADGIGPAAAFSNVKGLASTSTGTLYVIDAGNNRVSKGSVITTATGSLQVSILPAGAVSAGAQWQVDGGALQGSGAAVAGLTVGSHTVAFSTVSGWTTPVSQTVTVNANLTTAATGTYVVIPGTGSLQVSILPAGAVSAGAQWQVDGGALQGSGATVAGLSVGSHTVAFSTVSGWTTPASQTVTVNANLTTTATGTYVVIPNIYVITVSASPVASGSTSGGGTVNSGSNVTVVAVPNTGYSFVKWTEAGIDVSTAASYSFIAISSRILVANFTSSARANADLASLVPSAATLSPAFASGTLSYTASVTNATTTITVMPTVALASATVKVNGTTVASGTASGAIALSVGPNTITTIVTAQDGVTTKTYTITVNRASPLSNNGDLDALVPSAGALAPVFSNFTTSYTESVPNATASMTVTPTVAQANATVKVNAIAVASGTATGAIALSVGANVITMVVTAQDGITTKTYTIIVTRASLLSNDLDLTFGTNGIVSTSFGGNTGGTGVALQSDGKIIVVGGAGNYPAHHFAIARYLGNGSLDTIFAGGAGKTTTDFGTASEASAVAVQTGGGIIVASRAGQYPTYQFALARYQSDGTLDTVFGKIIATFASTDAEAVALVLQADGKIILAGTSGTSGSRDFLLARYKNDGTLDTTFGGTGHVVTDFGGDDLGLAVALQADGKIVVSGQSNNNFAIARYLSSGTLDTTFGGTGKMTSHFGWATSVAVQADGKIVVAGGNGDFVVDRFNSDGSPDSTFGVGSGSVTTDFGYDDGGDALALQPDGRIVVAGHIYASGSISVGVACYNTNGSLDTSFGSGTGKVTTYINSNIPGDALALQADGKIVVAGANGSFAVARYLGGTFTVTPNADLASLAPSVGVLSPAFAPGTTSYTESVPKSALRFTVTPTVAVAGATVTVSTPTFNGGSPTSVASGSASPQIPLNIGANPAITITVTAPDGVTTKTYMVTITRSNVIPSEDVNSDGKSDLVFQNTGTGQVYAWFLDGTGASINFSTGSGIKSTGYLYGGSLFGWQLMGIADVNGDGIPDLVFQNIGTGQVYAYFLDGSGASVDFVTGRGIKGTGYLYAGSLLGWRLAGIADVNGDGNPDLLFQNTGTSQVYAWFLDGTGASINFATGAGIKGTGYLYGGSLVGWQLAGIADVNGDGIADLIFQNTGTGQVYAWFLDGTGASINFGTGSGIKGTGYLYGGSLVGWQLTSISDVNGDGIPDLLFQNTGTGQIYAWFLDGTGASINFGTGSGIKSTGYLYGGSLVGWLLH